MRGDAVVLAVLLAIPALSIAACTGTDLPPEAAPPATATPAGYVAPALPTTPLDAYPPTDAGEGSEASASPGLANPASVHCTEQGGRLVIEARPDGGQFGVCVFDGGKQCEEWALMRGECPPGGIEVTGYATPAGRYCAITGGTYAVTAEGDADTQQGTCTFPDGSTCDAWSYWRGECARGSS